jgi:hypothetical protein
MDGCGGTICSRSALVFHPLLNCSRDFIISYCTYVRSGCQSMVMVRLPMQLFRCVAFSPVAMVDSDVCSRIL